MFSPASLLDPRLAAHTNLGEVIARDTGGREPAGQIGQGGGEEEKTSKEEIRRQVMLDYPYFPTEGLEKFMEPAKYF